MLRISQIHQNSPLTIYPTHTGIDLVARPDFEHSIATTEIGTSIILDWFSATDKRKELFERNLQRLSDNHESEPLLTTWFSINEFEALTSDIDLPVFIQKVKGLLPRWRKAGITEFYIEGHQVTSPFCFDVLSGQSVIFAPPGAGKTFSLVNDRKRDGYA